MAVLSEPSIYDPENRLWLHGSYVLGKKNGVWKEYYADTTQSNTNYEERGPSDKPGTVDVVIDHNKLSLFQAGSYLNDRRVGEWITFSEDGQIIQRYNVSKSLLLQDESITDSSQVSQNRHAIYFGGKNYLRRQLLFALATHLGPMLKHVKDVAIVKVVLQIDEKGNLSQWNIQESNTKPDVEKAIVESLEVLNKANWIPKLENGVAKTARVTLTYTFTKDKPQSFRDKSISAQIFISP